MEPSPREAVPSGRKRAIEELVQGQGYLNKLKDVLAVAALGNKNSDSEGEITRDLIEKVIRSFDNSLSALSLNDFEETSRAVVSAGRPMKRGKTNASEDSEGSVRSSLGTTTSRDRRGCYKRRSIGETWTELTPGFSADGHQWRKYGQKPILNAAHPRNYFRCTHKSDQGCMATKQVQKISEDPIEFRTVYQGQHTCKNDDRLKSTEIVSDNYGSQVLISFQRNGTITAPSKNEEPSEKGDAVVVVPSASSNIDYFNIYGDSGGDVSILSSDPGDAMSYGHRGDYMDMAVGWDDPSGFELDYGSAGDA